MHQTRDSQATLDWEWWEGHKTIYEYELNEPKKDSLKTCLQTYNPLNINISNI